MKYVPASMPAIEIAIPDSYDALAIDVMDAYLLNRNTTDLRDIIIKHPHILMGGVHSAIFNHQRVISENLKKRAILGRPYSSKDFSISGSQAKAEDTAYLGLVLQQVRHDLGINSGNHKLRNLEQGLTGLICAIQKTNISDLDYYLNTNLPVIHKNEYNLRFDQQI